MLTYLWGYLSNHPCILRAESRYHFVLAWRVIMCSGSLAFCGCAPQIPLTSWNSPPPTSSFLYPPVVTTGDVLEVRYYHEAKAHNSSYLLGIGDVLRVDIDGYPELDREKVIILSDGTISLPLIGTVKVAEKSAEEASESIKQRYSRKLKDPIVVVSVVEDQQRLKRLLEARRSGSEGDSLIISVYQGMPVSLPFIGPIPVDRPLDEIRKDISDRYAKEFGSQLNVVVNLKQRESPNVLVMGEVKQPGKITMTQPLTPMAAIASAGGYTDTADPARIVVIRFSPRGVYQRWIFDLNNDINEPISRSHNFTLAKNDVVLVVKTDIADLNLWIAQYIRNNIPFTPYLGATIPIGL
jgi:polysaccharide export outer membrane protein